MQSLLAHSELPAEAIGFANMFWCELLVDSTCTLAEMMHQGNSSAQVHLLLASPQQVIQASGHVLTSDTGSLDPGFQQNHWTQPAMKR